MWGVCIFGLWNPTSYQPRSSASINRIFGSLEDPLPLVKLRAYEIATNSATCNKCIAVNLSKTAVCNIPCANHEFIRVFDCWSAFDSHSLTRHPVPLGAHFIQDFITLFMCHATPQEPVWDVKVMSTGREWRQKSAREEKGRERKVLLPSLPTPPHAVFSFSFLFPPYQLSEELVTFDLDSCFKKNKSLREQAFIKIAYIWTYNICSGF